MTDNGNSPTQRPENLKTDSHHEISAEWLNIQGGDQDGEALKAKSWAAKSGKAIDSSSLGNVHLGSSTIEENLGTRREETSSPLPPESLEQSSVDHPHPVRRHGEEQPTVAEHETEPPESVTTIQAAAMASRDGHFQNEDKSHPAEKIEVLRPESLQAEQGADPAWNPASPRRSKHRPDTTDTATADSSSPPVAPAATGAAPEQPQQVDSAKSEETSRPLPPKDSPEEESAPADPETAESSTPRQWDSPPPSQPEVQMDAAASAPELRINPASGDEDGDIALHIDVRLTDRDGSETLGEINISGLPEGAVLSAGTRNNDGSWSLSPGDLEGLTMTPPADFNDDFNLRVTATSVEQNGDTALTSAELPVTVNPVEDAAEISGDLGGSTTEDDAGPVTGHLQVEDPDRGESSFTAGSIDGRYGVLEISEDGTWNYTPDRQSDKIQSLGEGEQLQDVITIHTADGTEEQITITINGRDDAEVVSGRVSGNVTEDTDDLLSVSGSISVEDIDNPDAAIAPQSIDGSYGNLTIDGEGNWEYTADNNQDAVQQLGEGDQLTESFSVSTVDGTRQEITITINGTNDGPVAADDAGGEQLTTDEDSALTITPQTLLANDTDIDGNDLSITAVSSDVVDADGRVMGSAVLDDDGNIVFTPNDRLDSLAEGETEEVHFSYTLSDGNGTTDSGNVTLKIQGTNDEVGLVIDQDVRENIVLENAENGTEIHITGLAADADGDAITYSLVDSNGKEVTDGPFAVDEKTGAVTVNDRSQIDFESAASHDLTIRATSEDGSTSDSTFQVQVKDVELVKITDLGGDENGIPVTFKLTGDHYDPADNQDVGAGSPKYQILVNGEYVTVDGRDVFTVEANRSHVVQTDQDIDNNGSADQIMVHNGNDYELVTFKVPPGTDIQSVSIQFVNNASDGTDDRDGDGVFGEDRNLVVDNLNIGGKVNEDGSINGGVTLEAEDASVSRYLAANGTDVSGTETMSWQGTMSFYPDGVPDNVEELFTEGSDNVILENSDPRYGEEKIYDALDGNDMVIGGKADDHIRGGRGNDRLGGGDGDDTFHVSGSEDGYDMVQGGNGIDRILGSDGDDVIGLDSYSGQNTVEIIDGGGGDNVIQGSAKANLDFSHTELKNIREIRGGEGDNRIIGSRGNDNISGGEGNDTLYGGTGNDSISGGAGNDNIRVGGDKEVDKVDAGQGDDYIYAGGNDVIDGGEGNDTLDARHATLSDDGTGLKAENIHNVENVYGSKYDDQVKGGEGKNRLYGYGGDDTLDGGAGNDDIRGGEGDDILIGGEGNDYIAGGSGDDIIDAGDGNDIVVFSGKQEEYNIVKNENGSYTVQDTVEGRDGDDIVMDAERFRFVDGTVDAGDLTLAAKLIDGAVEGVEYTTSSGLHGFTDEDGGFRFKEGDEVTFKIGGVTLGVATAEDVSTGKTFLQDVADVDRTDLNDEYLENMATFLQSLDENGNAYDGIAITDEIRESLADVDIDLRTASEEDVKQLVNKTGKTYVSEDKAMEHVEDMLVEHTDLDHDDFEEHVDDNVMITTQRQRQGNDRNQATIVASTVDDISAVESSSSGHGSGDLQLDVPSVDLVTEHSSHTLHSRPEDTDSDQPAGESAGVLSQDNADGADGPSSGTAMEQVTDVLGRDELTDMGDLPRVDLAADDKEAESADAGREQTGTATASGHSSAGHDKQPRTVDQSGQQEESPTKETAAGEDQASETSTGREQGDSPMLNDSEREKEGAPASDNASEGAGHDETTTSPGAGEESGTEFSSEESTDEATEQISASEENMVSDEIASLGIKESIAIDDAPETDSFGRTEGEPDHGADQSQNSAEDGLDKFMVTDHDTGGKSVGGDIDLSHFEAGDSQQGQEEIPAMDSLDETGGQEQPEQPEPEDAGLGSGDAAVPEDLHDHTHQPEEVVIS